MVYEQLVGTAPFPLHLRGNWCPCCDLFCRERFDFYLRPSEWLHTSILRANKQVSLEAGLMLYSSNVLSIDLSDLSSSIFKIDRRLSTRSQPKDDDPTHHTPRISREVLRRFNKIELVTYVWPQDFLDDVYWPHAPPWTPKQYVEEILKVLCTGKHNQWPGSGGKKTIYLTVSENRDMLDDLMEDDAYDTDFPMVFDGLNHSSTFKLLKKVRTLHKLEIRGQYTLTEEEIESVCACHQDHLMASIMGPKARRPDVLGINHILRKLEAK